MTRSQSIEPGRGSTSAIHLETAGRSATSTHWPQTLPFLVARNGVARTGWRGTFDSHCRLPLTELSRRSMLRTLLSN